MIEPKKLMRGVYVALAILVSAPVVGVGVPVFGVQPALAQSEQLIASVLFEGNQRFSDAQLLTMVNVATRGVYTESGVQADVQSIQQAYDQQGYTNVTVSARTELAENGRVRVTFVVNEGERAGIAAINFTGNNTFNSGTLKGVINTKETGFLSWLFRDDTYDGQKLNYDKELIRLYYANHGYPDAQVTSAVAEFDPQRNAYFVNFTVVEGEKYSFGNVGIETSIPGLNADAMKGLIQTGSGGRYSLADLQKSAEELAYDATGQGYPFADVRPRLDRDPVNKVFNVTYLVDEGARVYVERINITGNTKTRDFVIRRELDFAEGDPFNRSIVLKGKAAVEKLGFFSAVQIGTEPGSAPDKVVLNINVVEQSSGEYGLTAGYSTADGILGEVSLVERNFLGRGQFLRIAVGATESGRTFDFSFTEPRFMGLRVSAGVDAYHRINDETATNYFGSEATGAQLRFGVPLTRDLSASVFTGIEQKTFHDGGEYDDNGVTKHYPNDSSIVADGQVNTKAWVGYGLTFNTLDNEKKPTEGLLANFTQQYVGLDIDGTASDYIKTEFKARYFMPLMEDSGIVASVRGQAGIINAVSEDGGIDPTQAFNFGTSLIRGFKPRHFGPVLNTGEYLGATAYLGLSAELEFPIPVLPESYGLRGAVWADAAYIPSDYLPTIPAGTNVVPGSLTDDWRTSIGASLIWDSPFGPLRGDFAHVLSQAEKDETQVFQLTLSTLL